VGIIENVKQENKKNDNPIKVNGMTTVVCTYNDPINFVKECLNSLLSQEEVKEIVVVDSSDNDSIKNFCFKLNENKIKYVYTPPKGLSDARNKGIEVIKNNIIAFTDSDCIADNYWAKNICKAFEYDDSVTIVGGSDDCWGQNPPKMAVQSKFFKKVTYSVGFLFVT
jgi:glycosyltransferase involved in cell wall biosynthesis